ncbi:DUF2807 domain-containing protein [Steroidobacter sp. S1-65]|uniref:DUF2807 domain-containing protein n=1 Tax=Steroidobacter gossypii TaxID=2805490 RepID=A0ABS1WST3_9GAMM|nr:DUF2807 domain-containing protein [Steroidobacter gossypii]MBM0104003.1 DUF2807 domain-containing protein [Steroidobacter gossypii]
MNTYPLLGALSVVALLLGGCGDRGDRWSDRGPLVSERRELDGFDSIEVEGATKLEITIGEPTSVLVKGNESAVERVATDVRGDTLKIKSKARDWFVRNNNSRLTVQITLPKLESLELEGGNDVSVVGFQGGATRIKAAGAANLKADGQLDQLTIRMSGAGNADLGRLLVADATVTVDGVGNVVVNAVESLDATMNGVGAIFYTGTPRRVNTRMNGLGTIAQRGSASEQPDASPGVEPPQPAPVDPESLELEREDPKPKSETVDHKEGRIIVI